MTEAYLLPCECGESLRVTTSQAGQKIQCPCGRAVDAPSLRAIRSLERDSTPAAETGNTRQWSAVAGAVFALGALVVLLGLAIGCFGLIRRMALTIPEPPADEVAAWVAQVDDASIDEMPDVWESTLNEGLGEYRQPYLIVKREAEFFGVICLIGVATAAAGVGVIGSTAWLRKGRKA